MSDEMHWTCECGWLHLTPHPGMRCMCGATRPVEPIPEGYDEPVYWMRRADGYARVCSALGIVREDGTLGDVDAVLARIEALQQRAARVHELETRLADAWDAGAEYAMEASGWAVASPPDVYGANPYYCDDEHTREKS